MNENNSDQSVTQFSLPCRHLRSKEMYHQEPGQPDDAYSSGIFWCGKTQESFGPDGVSCGKDECCGNRGCFVT